MPQTFFNFEEIARECGSTPLVNAKATRISEIAWDTRLIANPALTLFLALPGSDRDGHHYIQDAWDKGVRNFLISNESAILEGGNFIVVPNVISALQKWAAAHRRKFKGRLIAITGSNGKTTVKEWLSSVLEPQMHIYKSPRSFNSQLGVPISILQMDLTADVALIEAGISRVGEMQNLQTILQPDAGLLTHMGDAHAEGFNSFAEKLKEKFILFEYCETLLCSGDDDRLLGPINDLEKTEILTIGHLKHNPIRLGDAQQSEQGWTFSIEEKGEEIPFHLSVPGEAAYENVSIVILLARWLGMNWEYIRSAVEKLSSVSMRTEMITDNPEVTVINDAYNADVASLRNAFSLLQSNASHEKRIIILSDLEHQGLSQEKIQLEILAEVETRFDKANTWLVGPMFYQLGIKENFPHCFPNTQALIEGFEYSRFRNGTVLLKGARSFGLEQIIPWLTRRANATFFKVNMNALMNNYRHLRKAVPAGTKMMAMVKAFSYGSGSWEVAEALSGMGIDYLAVAAATEGIALRTGGIRTPVMVMSSDETAMSQLFSFDLEPEVYGFSFLKSLLTALHLHGAGFVKIHIKVDTGMGRLGFLPSQAKELSEILSDNPELKVVSILSHLATADDSTLDAFTFKQEKAFSEFCGKIEKAIGYKPLRHILNTAGLMRFPQFAFDMVRAGIGLYGVSPVEGIHSELEEIGSLHSVIQQIHSYDAGTFVGYGCSQSTERKSLIATIPVGYADGIRRSLSNGKIAFLVRGKRAPVFGRICMDMIMLDVTDIPGVGEGDEVVLFGKQGNDFISVNELALKCDTIPYEILSGISQRVRRIYIKE